jgi:predicted nucleotidyltransferase
MLPAQLKDRLAQLAPRYGIRLALVFGSAVTGRGHERSDFDLALLLEDPKLSVSVFSELLHELQSAIPASKLDLAMINHADPLFLHQITSACELAFGSPEALERLRLYAFRRFQDHRRYLEMERAYVRRIASESA